MLSQSSGDINQEITDAVSEVYVSMVFQHHLHQAYVAPGTSLNQRAVVTLSMWSNAQAYTSY